jgi:2-isopropylmalate synthase
MNGMRHVGFFDTTLRDGEQAPGYSMSVAQKIDMAQALERLGLNIIETGFPASSPVDFEATREICRTLHRATPCGFARAVADDIDACASSMRDAASPQIELASVGSDIHIKYKRGVTREVIVDEAKRAIRHARAVGFTDISLALEDATRGDPEFMKQLIGEAIDAGITAIAVPDTVGCMLPVEFYSLIHALRDFMKEAARISIHCHNDLGLAVANSVAGLEAGADEVQTTLCGIGERAGNANMEELVAVLANKQYTLNVTHDIVQHRLFETCALLAKSLNLSLPLHKPIIGANAFSTEAGMHQQGVMKFRFTYEFMRAEDFGAESKLVIGRHSGRNILRQRLRQAGVREVLPPVLDRVYAFIMSGDDAGRYNDIKLLAELYQQLASTDPETPA